MFTSTIIGNLGADAEVRDYNGKKFVSFKVAHSESWQGQDGVRHDRMQWISCALNGDGGNLLQFLKKGTKVCVIGDTTVSVVSSQKSRSMVPAVNVAVRSIELCGGSSDEIPREIVTDQGEVINVYKAYYVKQEKKNQYKDTHFFGKYGGQYLVDPNGYVTKSVQDETNQEPTNYDGF